MTLVVSGNFLGLTATTTKRGEREREASAHIDKNRRMKKGIERERGGERRKERVCTYRERGCIDRGKGGYVQREDMWDLLGF